LALGLGQVRVAIKGSETLAPVFDGDLCGRFFKRSLRTTLARARMIEGDLAPARAALMPLFERWEREEEGPFALSALLPMAAVEVAGAAGDANEAARWSGELEALGSGPRAKYARALATLTAAVPAQAGAIEEAAAAVEADGRVWEGAWMRIVG